MSTLATPHGPLPLPAFLPDATRGVVRALDAADLEACGCSALMVNALHLAESPGLTRIAAHGGIHRFMGWRGPVASDSGGFQAYSLAAGEGRVGSGAGRAVISDAGIVLRRPGRRRALRLSPEKSIEQQLRLGSDLLFCLDQCPHPKASAEAQREAVTRTIAWARRCRLAFDRGLETRARAGTAPKGAAATEGPAAAEDAAARPRLFAIVQGGNDPALRRACAEALLEIGFDGYGFGGWPIDGAGRLVEAVGLVASLLPPEVPKHGLGLGKPETLVAAWRLGYRLFDCVIPTRDARHGRLFRFAEAPETSALAGRRFYTEIGIKGERYARQPAPVEEGCPCPLCRRTSAGYLHHLFTLDDPAAARLATLHNLTFYRRLIDALRARPQPSA